MYFQVLWCSRINIVLGYPESPTQYPTKLYFSCISPVRPLYFSCISPIFNLYFSCKSRCSDAEEWMQCWVTRNFPLNILLQCISPVCPLYFPCISLITVLRPYCGSALGLLYMLKLVTDDSCSCRYLGSVRDEGAEAGQQEQTWGKAGTLANSLTQSVLHRVANSLSLCRQCRSKSSRLTIHVSDIVCT